MNKNHLVSIILPTYNGSRYIKQSIDSCLEQSYRNLELIIINDGSSGGTEDIIKSYSDPRIRYFRNEKNIGLPESLNVGFKNAKGEYLTWTSDDNFYDNKAIEVLADELNNNQKIGLVYSNFYQIDENAKIIRRLNTCRPEVLDMKNCVGPCFLYRKEVYKTVGDYDPYFSLAEDYEYWLRVSRKFKLKKISGYLCYYRLHQKSLRSQNSEYKIEEQAQKASDRFIRPSMKYYHEGKVAFRKDDFNSSKRALIKSIALEPFNFGTWKLIAFVYLKEFNYFLPLMSKRIFPAYYFKNFYCKNTGKTDWNGEKACFSLSFDCDYTKDINSLNRLLDIISHYSFKASFACVGKFIEKYPAEHKRILKEGHEIINHTYTHPDNEELNPEQKFNVITAEQRKLEIEKCHNVCKEILGYEPVGFRTPHFGNLHTEDVYTILKNLGYKYSSSVSATQTSSFGRPFLKDGIIEFPISNCPKHPFAVFDTWHSLERGNGRHTGENFYKVFKELIDMGINTNSYINLYFDPQDVVNLKEFRLILDYIETKKGDIWAATYKDIFEKMYAGN